MIVIAIIQDMLLTSFIRSGTPCLSHLLRRTVTTRSKAPYSGSTREGVLKSQIKEVGVDSDRFAVRLRFSPPHYQLICDGGTAKLARRPKYLLLQKNGLDDVGQTVWTILSPRLPLGLFIYDIKVSYEGLRGPRDRYVRKGSAIVRYKIDDKSIFGGYGGYIFLVYFAVFLFALML